MNLRNFLSPKQIRENFKRDLQAALDTGRGPQTEQGYDFIVFKAIAAVAQGWPYPDPVLVKAARDELERQLDGTHVRLQLSSDIGSAKV